MSDASDLQTLEPIAIVGMACRVPGAGDVAGFWRNLRDGVESIHFFTKEELRAAGVGADEYGQQAYVAAHGRLEGIDRFDAAFFGISPREAESLDPQHRIFLECAWEAVEHAGHNPDTIGERFGVVASCGMNGYLLHNILPRKDVATPANLYALFVASDKDFLPTRVSYKLNLRGPSLNVNTACSSSLVAVHVACQMLWSYQCDGVLAGGVSVQVPQDRGYVHQPGAIVSPDGHCRAFDAAANGTVTGSGAGAVVLKRLSDALAAGDTVHAIIRGSAINNDGALKAGFTAPGVDGQAAVIAEAAAIGGVPPETLSYVEAHGTGTTLGDPIEVSALTEAFGDVRRQSCRLGSVKTNIGHLDTAAGIAGLIKTVLALEHEAIPPTLHFTKPNPQIEFSKTPFAVCDTLTPWPRGARPRRAGISSFGIGGTNAHVVIEEGPAVSPRPLRTSPRLFVLSARSRAALDQASQRLASHLATSNDRPDDVAWTLAAGRKAFFHAAFIVAESTGELADALAARGAISGQRPASAPRIAFMFPGQGAQQAGAGRELYATEPAFRRAFDACADALIEAGAPDVRLLLFRERTAEVETDLRRTLHAQTALFAIGCALDALWRSWGIVPGAVIGHSSGEYAAAVSAGVLTLADAARALASRSRLMDSLPPGAMAAVGLSEAELRALVPESVHVAAVNAPALCTIAGPADEVAALGSRLADRGVLFRPLLTAHAFHSPAVDPVLDEFRASLSRITLHAPNTAFYSTVLGARADAARITDANLWVEQIRRPVLFAPALQALIADGFTTLVELGPGTTLGALSRQAATAPALSVPGLPAADERRTQLGALGRLWLAGANVDWAAVFEGDDRQRIPLPTYPFEHERFWIEPVQPDEEATVERDRSEWFYVPSWEQAPTLVDVAESPLDGEWLVFAREHGEDAALVAELTRRGARVSTILPAQDDDFSEALATLHRHGRFPDRVLHCWTAGDVDSPTTQARGFDVLLRFMRALARDGRTVSEITLLTSGLASVHGHEALEPHKACLLGIVGAIPPEFPGTRCRAIDVDTDVRVEDIARELTRVAAPPVAAWRGRRCWIPRFDSVTLPDPGPAAQPFRQGGTFLITGGTGGLGLVFAEHLARTVHANLILTSRRTFPLADTWEALSHGAVRRSVIDRPLADLVPEIAESEARIERDLDVQTVGRRPGFSECAHGLAAAYALEYVQGRGVLRCPGERATRTRIYEACEALPHFRRFVDHLLTTMDRAGLVRREADAVVLLDSAGGRLPADEQLAAACERYPGIAPAFQLLRTCATAYPDALSGRVPAISVLFPDGGRGRHVEAAERTEEHANNRVYRTVMADLLATLASRATRRPFRILEVGGGNAILAGLVAERLAALDVAVEYVFTDIGRSFVLAAEARARERGYGFMRFAAFDISRDPASQGFEPGSFDAVIGLDVVHATPSIRATVENLRTLLAAGGVFGLVESARSHPWNDMAWGLAEGWWAFEDPELRNENSPLLSTAKWEAVLGQCGFASVSAFPLDATRRTETDCSLVLAQRDATPSETDPAILAALTRITRHAAHVEVCTADVADFAAMEQVVADAEARFGRIDGVIHAAAVESKALIASRVERVEEMEFRPKVDGTRVLDRVFSERPLDFMVLCSSITAVLGGPGQVGYCGANAFLDAFACARARERDEPTVSINWGRWQGIGLARDFESWHESRTGDALVGGMAIDDGLEALRRILHYRIAPRVAVMTSEWRPQLRSATPLAAPALAAGLTRPALRGVSRDVPQDVVFAGSPVEQQLAAIWRQILGVTRFDRHTAFQDLGGDSLVGIQMIARIREQLGVQLPIHAVFDCPTIAELSARLERDAGVEMEEGTL